MFSTEIAIIEDNKKYRETLKVIVEANQGFNCSGVYANGMAALSGIRHQTPDMVLVDLDLPDISGIECIKILKSEFPSVHFVVITISDDEEKIFQALTSGASGYLVKEADYQVIIESIKEVLNGGAPMSPGIAKKVMRFFNVSTRDLADAYKSILTKREVEVLEYLVKGMRYREIGQALFISTEAVKSHCSNIYKKLQIGTKEALIAKVYSEDPLVLKLNERIKELENQVESLQKIIDQP